MAYATTNPTTNEVLQTFDSISYSEAEEKILKADQTFHSWRYEAVSERKKYMFIFADLLINYREELSQLITLEMGKRIAESRREIDYCAEISRFYAEGAEKFLADEYLEVEGIDAYIQHTPLGTLLGVMPWNFPFYQVVRFATPNLMAGNTIILKHASCVPQCALRIEKLFLEAGFAEGAYTNLFLESSDIEKVIRHSAIRGVSLTGGEGAGAAVASHAGKALKPSVLELGGNDPFIVLEDADLDKAVQDAARGRLVNAGQSCIAAKRFIILEPVAEIFTEKLVQHFHDLQVGEPLNEDTELGPLSSEEAAQGLLKSVEKAVQSGAEILCGGKRIDRKGAFFSPTILTGVQQENPIFNTELFGPVAVIYIVADEQEAISLANNSQFGLAGSVHTQDLERGRKVAERIESGMVFLNQSSRSRAELPFGGIKNSGYGRELSHLGILEFVNKKTIHLGDKS